MDMNFLKNLGAIIEKKLISTINGFSYLPAAVAMRLAGRPLVRFVDFDGLPYLAMPKGVLVAAEVETPSGGLQRVYLPVLGPDNKVILEPTLRDVLDSQQRCLVKALACVTGVGMSLYLGHDGHGDKTLKALSLTDSMTAVDLTDIQPLAVAKETSEGVAAYIEWSAALAMARVADPSFSWEVLWHNGKPYREVLGSVLVDVKVVFKGEPFIQNLAVMDNAFNPLPASELTVFNWNTAVMRCLAKAIAFRTGYGLSVYGEGVAPAAMQQRGRDTRHKGEPVVADAKVDTKVEPPKAEPVAAAPVEAAPAASEERKAETPPTPAEGVSPEVVAEALGRFQSVVKARASRGYASADGILSLFEALKVSTRFLEETKPACFDELIRSCVAKVAVDTVPALLEKLRSYGVLPLVSEAARPLVVSKLIRTTVERAVQDANPEILGELVLLDLIPTVEAVLDCKDVMQEHRDLLADLLGATKVA